MDKEADISIVSLATEERIERAEELLLPAVVMVDCSELAEDDKLDVFTSSISEVFRNDLLVERELDEVGEEGGEEKGVLALNPLMEGPAMGELIGEEFSPAVFTVPFLTKCEWIGMGEDEIYMEEPPVSSLSTRSSLLELR